MKKFMSLVLACAMVLGLAGFSVVAADTYPAFEIEFRTDVEGVQIFLYRDGVALPGYLITDEYGVASVVVANVYAQFSIRVAAPEGFQLTPAQAESLTIEPANNDEDWHGDIFIKTIEFEVVEEDTEEEYGYEYDYGYDYNNDEEVTPEPITAPVVTAPATRPASTFPLWPVNLFAFAPAW